MARVYAASDVASVQDKKANWDGAILQLPGDAVGALSYPIDTEGAVAVVIDAAGPDLATGLCDELAVSLQPF